MKELKFKTGKGEFLVVDMDFDSVLDKYKGLKFTFMYPLRHISELEASEIVDNALFDIHFMDYLFIPTLDDTFAGEFRLNTAIESLHSLLESKGITELTNKYIFKIND